MPASVGRHTYYARDLQIRTWQADEQVIIGSFCSIADQVVLCTGGKHRTDLASTFPFDAVLLKKPGIDPVYVTTPPTTIGHDVWIGTRAMILGGVKVGHGAVIAAGSVVFSDVPPYAIVAGNPAKTLRFRVSKATVAAMLRIEWWNWPDERLAAELAWFQKPVAEFAAHFDPAPPGGLTP
jgi:acetyltransferase-like isoleucine patch superfamily enzyme